MASLPPGEKVMLRVAPMYPVEIGTDLPGTYPLEEALSGFTLLLADKAIHRVAAQTQASCRARGVSAASFDALIAAHTLVVGGELLTLDNDFRHISPVVGLRLTPI
jgi:predicted nucleic acid-binding protein